MLRIFLTGDNHIGLRYRSHEKGDVLAKKRIDAFTEMVDGANREQCDLFVIAGDLFDDILAYKAEARAVMTELSAFRGTVCILAGNHDYYDKDAELWRTLHDETSKLDNVMLLTECRPYELEENGKKITLYAAPCRKLHSAPGENNIGWMKQQDMDPSRFNIGVAHGSIEGLALDKEGAYFMMTRDELDRIPVDAWLIGHTHTPFPRGLCSDPKPAGKVFNAGAHVQANVNNDTEGQCFIIGIDDEKHVRAAKFVSGNMRFVRRKITLRAGEADSILEKELADIGDESAVDLILTGSVDPAEYDKLNEIVKNRTSRFIEAEFDPYGVTKLISKSVIDAEFPETSLSAQLLTALLGDPKETQLAYDMLKSLKGGQAK